MEESRVLALTNQKIKLISNKMKKDLKFQEKITEFSLTCQVGSWIYESRDQGA